MTTVDPAAPEVTPQYTNSQLESYLRGLSSSISLTEEQRDGGLSSNPGRYNKGYVSSSGRLHVSGSNSSNSFRAYDDKVTVGGKTYNFSDLDASGSVSMYGLGGTDTFNAYDGGTIYKAFGGSGTDYFDANSGGSISYAYGESGNDYFDANSGGSISRAYGGDGTNDFDVYNNGYMGRIYGGTGYDNVYARSGSDISSISTSSGNDYIRLGAGVDASSISAGNGNDNVYIDSGAAVSGSVSGGSGTDDIYSRGDITSHSSFEDADVTYSDRGVNIHEYRYRSNPSNNHVDITGSGSGDIVNLSKSGSRNIFSFFDQTDATIPVGDQTKFYLDNNNFIINTAGGADTINLDGNVSVESLDTGTSGDTINVLDGASVETLNSGSGNDTIINEGNIENISGGSGTDSLTSVTSSPIYEHSQFEMVDNRYKLSNGCEIEEKFSATEQYVKIFGSYGNDDIRVTKVDAEYNLISINGSATVRVRRAPVSIQTFKRDGQSAHVHGNDSVFIGEDVEITTISTGKGNDKIETYSVFESADGGVQSAGRKDTIINKSQNEIIDLDISGFERIESYYFFDDAAKMNGDYVYAVDDKIDPSENYIEIYTKAGNNTVAIEEDPADSDKYKISINRESIELCKERKFVKGTISVFAERSSNATITLEENVKIDTIHTGNANSTINLNSGSEVKNGIRTGSGQDIINIADGVTINNGIDVGSGTNQISIGKNCVISGNTDVNGIIAGNGANTIDVGNNTQISNIETGNGNDQITLGDNVTITNGLIAGNGANTITAGNNCHLKSIEAGSANDTVTLGQNTRIDQKINAGAGNNELEIGINSQLGDIETGSGKDTITLGKNSTINNSIAMGSGENTITLGDNVTVSVGLTAGNGNNTLVIGQDSEVNRIQTGTGIDLITLGDNVTVAAGLLAGDGTNTITAGDDCRFGALQTGNADDIITLGENTIIDAALNAGNGDNTIVVGANSEIDEIETGSGADDLTLAADSTVNNSISLGHGENTLKIARRGSIGDIETGNDIDILKIAEDTQLRNISTGSGDDEIYTGKNLRIQSIDTAAGDDQVSISRDSIVTSQIDTGAGDDTIVNNGEVNVVNGGTGIDRLVSPGTTNFMSGIEESHRAIRMNNGGEVWVYENTIDPSKNFVNVIGSSGDDSISLQTAGPGQYLLSLNGETLNVSSEKINIKGGDGDDTIRVASGVEVDEVHGEAGDDTINNFGYIGTILGGDGVDTLDDQGTSMSHAEAAAERVEGADAYDENGTPSFKDSIEIEHNIFNDPSGAVIETFRNDVNPEQSKILINGTADVDKIAIFFSPAKATQDVITGIDARGDHIVETVTVENPRDTYNIALNGTLYTLDAAKVEINSYGANDQITIGDNVEASVINTGSGNDIIKNSGSIENIDGGSGEDFLGGDDTSVSHTNVEKVKTRHWTTEGAKVIEYEDETTSSLAIWGTTNADRISISATGTPDRYSVEVNSQVFNVSAKSLHIYGLDGNDTIIIGNNVNIAKIDAGAGNDSITNRGSIQNLEGGKGTDSVTGSGSLAHYEDITNLSQAITTGSGVMITETRSSTENNCKIEIRGVAESDLIDITRFYKNHDPNNEYYKISINGDIYTYKASQIFLYGDASIDNVFWQGGVKLWFK